MRTVVLAVVMVALASAPVRADEGERWDGTTIALQGVGGLAGGLVGGATLGLAGVGIGYAIDQRNWGVPLVGGVVLGGVGMIVGTSLGVHWAGDSREGTGRWWGTTLGATVGVAAAAGYGYLVADTHSNYAFKLALGYLVFLAPTVIGYQLSADSTADPQERTLALPLTLGSF